MSRLEFLFILGLSFVLAQTPAVAGNSTGTAAVSELPSVGVGQVSEDLSRFRGACSKSEWWSFSSRIEPVWRDTFNEFMGGKMSPVRGFSEAMALRSIAKTEEARLF